MFFVRQYIYFKSLLFTRTRDQFRQQLVAGKARDLPTVAEIVSEVVLPGTPVLQLSAAPEMSTLHGTYFQAATAQESCKIHHSVHAVVDTAVLHSC